MTKEKKAKNVVIYVAGSAILCGAAVYAIPKIAPKISGAINKHINKIENAKKDEDDWGPELVKK